MRRLSGDVIVLVTGIVVLATSTLAALPHSPGDVEVAVFGWLNHAGDVPRALAWVPMQLGNVVVVPVSALVALALGRVRLALALGGAGMLAWVAAKGVKDVVERGRPGALVDDAVLRDAHAGGLGFPSGHVAVAVALAFVVWPHLGRAARTAVLVSATLVGILRVYVGAHLPLDITGGAGVGMACAGAVRS
ncbi:MAG TPA: phosphatase PAP2 family protein, partial [Acidimicrobiales bacterium]|nr:phosphatase PAP2 family protein [Acidimicrobiales bacterium]